MAKRNSEVINLYVPFILDCINKGTVQRNEVMELFCKRFNRTKYTFHKYWKSSKAERDRQIIILQKQRDSILLDADLEAFKAGLSNKDKQAQLLVQQIEELRDLITNGRKTMMEGKEVFIPVEDKFLTGLYAEIRQHFKLLGDWYGFNAPKKIETKAESIFKGFNLLPLKDSLG